MSTVYDELDDPPVKQITMACIDETFLLMILNILHYPFAIDSSFLIFSWSSMIPLINASEVGGHPGT